MKFDNERLNKEIFSRLLEHGIILNRDISKVTREQALVLIGEAMLDRFITEFAELWGQLFKDCRLKDFAISDNEKKRVFRIRRTGFQTLKGGGKDG